MKQYELSLSQSVHTIFHKALQYITTCMLRFSIVVHIHRTGYSRAAQATDTTFNIVFKISFVHCTFHHYHIRGVTHTVLSDTGQSKADFS